MLARLHRAITRARIRAGMRLRILCLDRQLKAVSPLDPAVPALVAERAVLAAQLRH